MGWTLSFCGLGFKTLWAGQIASCKHVYHNWCAFVHFSESTKCIDALCGDETHGGWWNFIGIIKLGVGAMLELCKQFAIKKTWQNHALGKHTSNLANFAVIYG